jgi:gluconate 5-dehydrogenase
MADGTRSDPESRRYFMDRTRMGRKGRPDEVVGAAIVLAAECSSTVTGQVLVVDGGFLAAWPGWFEI